jgi:hypothetical protein
LASCGSKYILKMILSIFSGWLLGYKKNFITFFLMENKYILTKNLVLIYHENEMYYIWKIFIMIDDGPPILAPVLIVRFWPSKFTPFCISSPPVEFFD